MGLFKKKKIEKVVLSKEELKKFEEEKKSNEPENYGSLSAGENRVRKFDISEYDIKNPLIPAGGTTNWVKVCDEFGYDIHGYYTEPNPIVINIAHDCKISIENVCMYTQSKPFFTCVNFAKKEIVPELSDKTNGPHIYERQFHIYYPYGTMFDLDMIRDVGYGLNAVINASRDYRRNSINKQSGYETVKNEIVKLFIDGCSDKDAVNKILNSIALPKNYGVGGKGVRVSRDIYDWISDTFEHKYLKSKKQESQPE